MSHATARRIRRNARQAKTGCRGFDHFRALKIDVGDCKGASAGVRVFGGIYFERDPDGTSVMGIVFRHPTKRPTLGRTCRREFDGRRVSA